jgi:hypothetical protein
MAARSLAFAEIIGTAARISAQVAWDRLAAPRARHARDVPASDRAITPEWLTAVLCRGRPGVHVAAVELGAGSSGTSVRRQFKLTYDEAGERAVAAETGRRGGLPRSVVAKMSPTVTTRLALGISRAMVDEWLAYTHFRPHLGPGFEAPWGYHAAYDLRTFRHVTLMEDLVGTRGATFCSPETTITRERAEDMVGVLAALHGAFYADPRLEEHAELKRIWTWWDRPTEIFRLDEYHERAMVAAADVMPSSVQRRRREVWPAFRRALALHEGLPHTLLHSDVHVGNWYVTSEGRMGLCDWQCIAKGHWSRDFAYAISAALTVEDRRAWERDLLRLYLDRLHAAGGERISFDEGWLRYRQQLFPALLMWTPTLCHSPLLPAMQPERTARELIKRIATAIGDLESLDSV